MIGRLYPVPGTRYVCKTCGAESPTGIGYVCQTAGPLPAPTPGCVGPHRPTAAADRWPTRTADGRTVWACCVSAIGPTCGHLAAPVS